MYSIFALTYMYLHALTHTKKVSETKGCHKKVERKHNVSYYWSPMSIMIKRSFSSRSTFRKERTVIKQMLSPVFFLIHPPPPAFATLCTSAQVWYSWQTIAETLSECILIFFRKALEYFRKSVSYILTERMSLK